MSRSTELARVMALDVGDRRIGVAVSDPLRLFARPLTTIDRRGTDALAAIGALIAEWQVALIVVGHPVLPSGDRGEQAAAVEAFVAGMADVTDVPIEWWDESYTTVTASERLQERGVSWQDAKGRLDAHAAAVILEEWLAERGGVTAPPPEEDP